MIRKTTSRKNTGASAGNIFRRILAMTLTLVLLTCFAGCGGNGDVKDTDAATDAVTVSDTDTG
ncbi:MAG: hypothetical protein IKN50_06825, partial [Clostridia bacterium]|nr:hypothetical protein [Clostridia bacterium]